MGTGEIKYNPEIIKPVPPVEKKGRTDEKPKETFEDILRRKEKEAEEKEQK